MKLRIAKNEEIETDDQSTLALSELFDFLAGQNHEMAAKIREAKAKAAVSGEYAETDWFNRIKLAKFKNGQVIEKLKVILAQRRRAENRAANPGLSEYFMEICRARMKPALFEVLYQEAMQRARSGAPLKAAEKVVDGQ